ncbi:hypothetical protein [Nocardioides sp. LHG3406-4]|uniref:hypothetical protein n=1 Tax=Nocardioides sp. LHG3406-4 TaxID=2804575 RepID=UPI003CF57191
MKYDRLWERLLEFLNALGTAREVAPGRLEVTLPDSDGPSRAVQIVMTRDEWDELVTIPYGAFSGAARHVQHALLALEPGVPFLVYDTYDLHPSTTERLPVEPMDEQRVAYLAERARQHPGSVGWFAYPPAPPSAPEDQA